MYKPGLYTKGNALQRQDADNICEEFSDEIGQMMGLCLDIGSGPGDVVADFVVPKLDPTAKIVCSDISVSMVKFGKERYNSNDRMSFVELDIETPDLPKAMMEKFDHVTSFYCINWCQNMTQVFKNIFDLLHPGGTAVLAFLANNPAFYAYQVLASTPCYAPYMKDVGRYVPFFQYVDQPLRALKPLLKKTGFEIRHSSCRERSHVFNTSDDLGKFMLGVNPFIDRMPADLQEVYAKDLVKEVAKQYINFNRNENTENECSILARYDLFILYLKKPRDITYNY